MERKEFKSINKKILTDYGFTYKNDRFFIRFEHSLFMLRYMGYPFGKGSSIACMMFIPELSETSIDEIPIDDWKNLIENPPYHTLVFNSISLDKIIDNQDFKNIYVPEDMTVETWKKEFTLAIHRMFDPYKVDEVSALKRAINGPDRFIVAKYVEEYIKSL